jgi:hypothetical protein
MSGLASVVFNIELSLITLPIEALVYLERLWFLQIQVGLYEPQLLECHLMLGII